ncbi:MAG: MFS transporter [Spirochaetales bacterium]|nr:MFS transporter [Spirochaetales bacterium]
MIPITIFYFFEQASVSTYTAYFQLILRNKGYSHSLIGLLMAVSQIATIIVPILVCALYDRSGKPKRTLLLSVMLAFAFYVPLALCDSLLLSFISIFISAGFFWALNPLYDGLSTRVLGGSSSKYGYVRAIGASGYFIILLVFGLLGFPNETDNVSITITLSVILGILGVIILSLPKSWNSEGLPSKANGIERVTLKEVLNFKQYDKKFLIMMGIIAISRIAQSVIDKFLSAYMTEELHVGNKFTLLIAFAAVWDIPFSIFGGRFLQSGKIKAWCMVFLSSSGLAIRLLLYAFFPTIVAFMCGQALSFLCFGAVQLGAVRFISDNIDEKHRAVGMSFYWSVATHIPQMFGSLLGGVIVEHHGYTTLFFSFSWFAIIATILCFAFRKVLSGTSARHEAVLL